MRHFTMRRVRISVLAAALISVASAPTSADVIHWHVPGVVDGSCGEGGCPDDNEFLLQFFPVGTHVDFDLAVDTHNYCSSPNVGVYDIGVDVTINGINGARRRPSRTAREFGMHQRRPLWRYARQGVRGPVCIW
jgi:hypothetical protein